MSWIIVGKEISTYYFAASFFKVNVFLRFFFAIFCLYLNPVNAEEKLEIKGISLGIYEKGNYLGAFSNLSDYEQFEFGLNYLNIPIGKYDIGFSKRTQVDFYSIGAKFNYRRYIHSKEYQGFYTDLGIELNNSSLSSRINLSELSYKMGNVTVLCPTCSTLDLYIKPKIVNIIPSFSIGWREKISKRIYLNTSIGLQYLKINNLNWRYNSNSKLPFFVKDEIDKVVKDVNSNIKDLPTFYPTLMMTFSYFF